MSDPYLIFSKSRSEAQWECNRLEYLKYLWGGLGLRALGVQFELEFGGIMHDGAAQLALPHMLNRPAERTYLDTPLVFLDARQRMEKLGKDLGWAQETIVEWRCIMEGLLRLFHRRILPEILREYEIIDVEVPMLLPVAPELQAWFVAKPDLILRSRVTKGYWYWEHKSTGSDDAKWVNSWTRAVQVHTGIKAAEKKYGVAFDGCYVLGWYKGYKDRYNNIQMSPFSYGWMSPGAPGITEDRYEYKKPTKWKGWERFPVGNLVEGMASWIAEMPDDIVFSQFIKTPPIMIREDLVEDYLEQLKNHASSIRMFQLAAGDDALTDREARSLLNEYFPQEFNKCEPSWGRYDCSMKECCWSSATAADPLASGLYRKNSSDSEHRLEFIRRIRVEEGQ